MNLRNLPLNFPAKALVSIALAGMYFFTSCSSPTQPNDLTIRLGDGMNEAAIEFAVQDFFADIDYIPLETNDSSLIGNVPHATVLDTILLVSSTKQPLKAFDRSTGKYLRDIGHIGNDPQGYSCDSWGSIRYWVDKDQGQVYFMGWNNDFVRYDLNGQYKGTLSVDESQCNLFQDYFLIRADTIWAHNKLRLSPELPSVSYLSMQTSEVTPVFTWDSMLLPIEEVLSISVIYGGHVAYGGDVTMALLSGDRKFYTAVDSPSLWLSGSTVRLKQDFNDTIYTVSPAGLIPYKVIDLGKWHWDEKDQYQVSGCKDKIHIDYVLETDRYFYFHFQTGFYTDEARSYCAFYDKRNGKVSVAQSDKLLDNSNNQSLQIRGVASDNSFFALLKPEDLLPETISRLKIGEEDNPVLVILK